ncbi:MAG TPA: selenide, water dikinase SelD [Casimicrobiaceae bacterium]|nr:selenide, water dikinase SelD [Casimicrobiaceae bacterium]
MDALERNAPDRAALRLTQFGHGGGCGCKIAPAVLQEILAKTAPGLVPRELLVGVETADDAAVYQINETQAIVATTDFFMPIVDDPFDFGAIAATNALSDVYAMGASPLFALALVGMPVERLPVETIRRVLEGGEAICAKAGIPIAGGHTIDSVEPIYGLAAIGIVDPRHLKRNSGALPGDALVLGKPLGIGIYSAALKKDVLDAAHYAAMLASTTLLNTPGIALGRMSSVHALTDVTGFGLLGHLLEMCRGSQAGARIEFGRLPLHPGVLELAGKGIATGASNRNWAGYGKDVVLAGGVDEAARALLTDPQTSGGLLVACAPDAVDEVLEVFRDEGFERATVVGQIVPGRSQVTVV